MRETDLVITGIGIVSPAGIGREDFWNGLIEAKDCFHEISLFETTDFTVKKAGEVADFNPLDFIEKRHLRTLDRSTRLLIAATQLAIDDARIEINEENTHEIGIVAGATFGSLHSICSFDIEGLTEGPRYVNPSFFPNTVINSPAGQVSIRFKIKGYNTTISTGFCASTDAFVYASDFLRLKRAFVSLVGGVEELCEETFRGFYLLDLLSGTDGTEPFSAPFDKRRNGLVLSEGAGVIVLENKEYATSRKARILAEVVSYAMAFSSNSRGTFNSESALKRAILDAIEKGGLRIDDIDLIYSSANSTKELDRMEARVLDELFKDKVPVTAIKSVLGETYSASGSLAIASAVETLNKGIIPPTCNVSAPEYQINIVRDKMKIDNINNILIITSDPYGSSTAIILGKYRS